MACANYWTEIYWITGQAVSSVEILVRMDGKPCSLILTGITKWSVDSLLPILTLF